MPDRGREKEGVKITKTQTTHLTTYGVQIETLRFASSPLGPQTAGAWGSVGMKEEQEINLETNHVGIIINTQRERQTDRHICLHNYIHTYIHICIYMIFHSFFFLDISVLSQSFTLNLAYPMPM